MFLTRCEEVKKTSNFTSNKNGFDAKGNFSTRVTLAIIASVILVSAFALPSLVPMQQAEAWDRVNNDCKWPTSTATFKSIGLSSTQLADVRAAATYWNNAGANIYLKETTGTPNITVKLENDPAGQFGRTVSFCTTSTPPGSFTSSTIFLNTAKLDTRDKFQWTIAHEFGHSIGLDHNQCILPSCYGAYGIMSPNYNTNIIAPTLDDIRGLKNIYGTKTGTSMCYESWNTNGDVTYFHEPDVCTSTNPDTPMVEKILTATSTSKAFASQTSGTTTIPSSGSFLMYANVKPNTNGLKKFAMGAWTSTNIGDLTKRFITLEVDNDGFYLVVSSTSGYTKTKIGTVNPVAGTEYFLELVIRNGQPSMAYIFKNDGDSTHPPSFVAKTAQSTQLSWSSSVYFGTGVWTTSSSDVKSNYNVDKYYNLRLGYS